MFEELEGVPMDKRTARFVCVIALVFPDGKEILARGKVEGKIAIKTSGENGFGYDSMFIPEGYDETFGVLSPEIKNSFSHRSRALEIMKDNIRIYHSLRVFLITYIKPYLIINYTYTYCCQ